MSYTNTDLLASIRTRGNLPTTTNSDAPHNTANLLILATEALHMELLPKIMAAREEFYVYETNQALVANQAEYAIPSRAAGQVLRDVLLIRGTEIHSIPWISPDHITSSLATGDVRGFYLRHNKVVLHPAPTSTDYTLRLRYFLRPGRLAATTDCAQISSIDTGANSVTVSSIPSTWVTGTVLDLVSANAPYAYLATDQTNTDVTSTTITFASLPTDLAVGDWVAPQGYSPIPQIPFEFQSVLAQAVVVQVLDLQGDAEGASAAFKKLATLQENAIDLITPRVQGEAKKIVQQAWIRNSRWR